VYFVRNLAGVIPVPNDLDEANTTLSTHVESGVLNSHSLSSLEQMISQVSARHASFVACSSRVDEGS